MATAELVRGVRIDGTGLVDAAKTSTEVSSIDQLADEIAVKKRVFRGTVLQMATFWPGVTLAGPGIDRIFGSMGSLFSQNPHPEQLLIGVGATAVGAFLVCKSVDIENDTNHIRWRARSSSTKTG